MQRNVKLYIADNLTPYSASICSELLRIICQFSPDAGGIHHQKEATDTARLHIGYRYSYKYVFGKLKIPSA